MFKNYFKIAWRNLQKSKVFSLINILGLSIGITCCLIIGIYVVYELSYDRFFPNYERIYRVVQEQEQAGNLYQVASTPAPLSDALKTNYPEVQEVTTFTRIFNKRLFQYRNISFEEEDGFHADPAFFKIFSFSLLNGSVQTFFATNNTILLTENMAQKYFGEENPVGKVITLDRTQDFVVAAVMKNLPGNSHIKFDFLLPMGNLSSYADFASWGNNWVYTYILLKETADANVFETKIKNLLSDHIGEPEWQPKLYLQSLKDIHLHSDFDFNTDFAETGNLQSIYLFGAIGLIILLISGINFINLTTARSFQRNKETGIRKVAGANRKQLIYQFMGESLLYILISTALAIGLARLVIPWFADLSGLPFAFDLPGTNKLIGLLLGILLIAGLLTGIYPALFLSNYNVVKMFGASFLQRGSRTHEFSSRKILIVGQFALSVILIVCAMLIRQQMHFVLNRDLGFDKEHILYFQVKGELGNEARYQSFKNALMQQSSILQVTRSNGLPINHEGSFEGIEWEGMPSAHQDFLMSYFDADEAFVGTFGLQILAGRNFISRKPGDSTAYYLVNETAMRVMQMDDPVGKKLEDGVIIGVVKDFNFQSAFKHIGPMILRSEPGVNMNKYISIRLAGGDMAGAVKTIGQISQQFNPDFPVEHYFLDESITALYDKQIRSGKLINIFAALAIFISCLGLFGLATFSAQRRLKEIGIRKVNGARISEILSLLNKDFVKWVVIAFVIATPIAYYAMHKWLENFAYKTELSWWIFALAGLLALGIALLTVSWQSWKAATRNPVEALRYE